MLVVPPEGLHEVGGWPDLMLLLTVIKDLLFTPARTGTLFLRLETFRKKSRMVCSLWFWSWGIREDLFQSFFQSFALLFDFSGWNELKIELFEKSYILPGFRLKLCKATNFPMLSPQML